MKKMLQTYYWNTIEGILLISILGVINGCYTVKQVPIDKTKDSMDDAVVITSITKKDGTRIKYPRQSGVKCIVRSDTLITFMGVDTLLREPASEFVSMVQIEYLTQSEIDAKVIDAYRTVEIMNMALVIVGGVILTIALIAILL